MLRFDCGQRGWSVGAAALLVAGCPPGEPGPGLEVGALEVDAPDVDSCRSACVSVSGVEAAVTVTGGPGPDLDLSQDSCWSPPLEPGVYELTARVGDEDLEPVELRVHPFGWDYGLDNPLEPLAAMPWVPEVPALGPPVLVPTPRSWDSVSTMGASTVVYRGERVLVYTGTDDTENQLGLAHGDDLVKYVDNPILTETVPDWRRYAQSNGELEVVGDELWLYYTGRAGTDGMLSIGLATSTDGRHFVDAGPDPVFSYTGVAGDFDHRGVAHPSVLQRDGVFELWYAAGTRQIGHALSRDGVHFERSCHNPVWSGDAASWDHGEVKAPEIAWFDGLYWMAYSGGGHAEYQVGWAASPDGERWVVHDQPLIPPSAWATHATQEAYLEVEDDALVVWFTGNTGEHQQIGRVDLAR